MNLHEYLTASNEKRFDHFMDTLFATNRTPEYWVNWKNVFNNTKDIEICLNTLNYLVGKPNIEQETRYLITQQPDLLRAIPILIASREANIEVLDIGKNTLETYNVDFSNPNLNNLDLYIEFMIETGLLNFLSKGLKQSLTDYVYGVQVGLDSNGRKNRSGTQNEIILENTAIDICTNSPHCEYSTQATGSFIYNNWGVKIPEIDNHNKKGRGGRRYDGVIYNSITGVITIIETNFYGGGGSKLKSVSGEFKDLYNECFKKYENINFVWITDGPGWETARNPLREAFDTIPTIFNLNMVKNGFLEELVTK